MDQLRIIMNPVGGSFGYSVSPNTFALVATAVQNLNMPCTLTLSYEEFSHMTGKRSASFTNGRIACDKDGKIIAAEYDVGLDHGAYGSMGSKILTTWFLSVSTATTSRISRALDAAVRQTTRTARLTADSALLRSTPLRRR
jgi:CO/xanthine dehydrogenase Mo-binding subunit